MTSTTNYNSSKMQNIDTAGIAYHITHEGKHIIASKSDGHFEIFVNSPNLYDTAIMRDLEMLEMMMIALAPLNDWEVYPPSIVPYA